MKKIIKGKKYDTDTAHFCGAYSYGSPTDFSYLSEALYKKKTGEFFLYGEGGAQTKYAETISDNEWCGGEAITPLTEDEAKEWAEINLDADEFEDLFGEVPE